MAEKRKEIKKEIPEKKVAAAKKEKRQQEDKKLPHPPQRAYPNYYRGKIQGLRIRWSVNIRGIKSARFPRVYGAIDILKTIATFLHIPHLPYSDSCAIPPAKCQET